MNTQKRTNQAYAVGFFSSGLFTYTVSTSTSASGSETIEAFKSFFDADMVIYCYEFLSVYI